MRIWSILFCFIPLTLSSQETVELTDIKKKSETQIINLTPEKKYNNTKFYYAIGPSLGFGYAIFNLELNEFSKGNYYISTGGGLDLGLSTEASVGLFKIGFNAIGGINFISNSNSQQTNNTNNYDYDYNYDYSYNYNTNNSNNYKDPSVSGTFSRLLLEPFAGIKIPTNPEKKNHVFIGAGFLYAIPGKLETTLPSKNEYEKYFSLTMKYKNAKGFSIMAEYHISNKKNLIYTIGAKGTFLKYQMYESSYSGNYPSSITTLTENSKYNIQNATSISIYLKLLFSN